MMRSLVGAVFLLSMFTGCASLKDIEAPKSLMKEATLGAKTPTEELLRSLAPADKVITLSVYDFKDYTGQNKPAETAQYSRAVTQGGLAIVKKSLLDAGNHKWFRVLERGALENLLQERKIIRSIREQYKTADGRQLPKLGPLLYSGLLLEGGIIAYESNVVTGGIGARYLGIGASSQYRRDMVTVYLRAISVTTGEVLVSVNTSKTIYSTLVDAGIFKYVSFDKIVEGEAGFSFNEPPQLAVRQAIEMGVYALVMEGYAEGLWKFKDQRTGDAELQKYVRKYDNVGERAREKAELLANKPEEAAVNRASKVKPVNYSMMVKPRALAQKQPERSKPLESYRATSRASLSNDATNRRYEKWPTTKKAIAKPPTKTIQRDYEGKLPSGWYVQVAAFSSGDSKKRHSLERYLGYEGFPVQTQRAIVDSEDYRRVLLGPFDSRADANMNMLRVRGVAGSGNGTPFIKQVIN